MKEIDVLMKISACIELQQEMQEDLEAFYEEVSEKGISAEEPRKVSICSQIKDNFLYFINKKCKLL